MHSRDGQRRAGGTWPCHVGHLGLARGWMAAQMAFAVTRGEGFFGLRRRAGIGVASRRAGKNCRRPRYKLAREDSIYTSKRDRRTTRPLKVEFVWGPPILGAALIRLTCAPAETTPE